MEAINGMVIGPSQTGLSLINIETVMHTNQIYK